MQVLLTRPLRQVKPLASLIEKAGHQPILFPTLVIEPIRTHTQNRVYDAVIFISTNAVDCGLSLLNEIEYLQVFAVGQATANRLLENNIKVDGFPQHNASSAALLALEAVHQLQRKRILIFRGKGGMDTLKIGLMQRNNYVEYAEVYQRVTCQVESFHQQAMLKFLSNNQGVISLTSVENMQALLDMVDDHERLKKYSIIALSERIKKMVNVMGFNQVVVAPQANDSGIVSALSTINILDKPRRSY